MDILFISLLVLVIFLTIWALNSYKSQQVESKSNLFEKGKTQYLEPPRPHSELYKNYIRLTSSVYSKQQKKTAFVMSQLIKEYFDLKSQTPITENKNLSKTLRLFLTDPDEWFSLQLNFIDRSGLPRKEGLFKHYIQILDEVEQLLSIPLLSEME
ncbi:MAG: hypothetical protein ACFFFH_09780 [Candidatus Thorarchaeota archaeon]